MSVTATQLKSNPKNFKLTFLIFFISFAPTIFSLFSALKVFIVVDKFDKTKEVCYNTNT